MLQKKTSKLSTFVCIDIQKKRNLKSRFPQNFCAVFLFKIDSRGKIHETSYNNEPTILLQH